MTTSKEARRREEARKKQRNIKIAKSTIVGLAVAVAPLLFYVATRI